MTSLQDYIRDIPDFPQPGVLFRDISPLLRDRFDLALSAMSALLTREEWNSIDAIAGIEARGFILAAGLASHHGKGFVPIRKEGKLPPPVIRASYQLEYGSSSLEVRRDHGRLLIVDDVLATGGTMRAAADLSIQAGYQVSALIALIDLRLAPAFEWQGIRVRSVVEY